MFTQSGYTVLRRIDFDLEKAVATVSETERCCARETVIANAGTIRGSAELYDGILKMLTAA